MFLWFYCSVNSDLMIGLSCWRLGAAIGLGYRSNGIPAVTSFRGGQVCFEDSPLEDRRQLLIARLLVFPSPPSACRPRDRHGFGRPPCRQGRRLPCPGRYWNRPRRCGRASWRREEPGWARRRVLPGRIPGSLRHRDAGFPAAPLLRIRLPKPTEHRGRFRPRRPDSGAPPTPLLPKEKPPCSPGWGIYIGIKLYSSEIYCG